MKNTEIVEKFYTAFSKLDHSGMEGCLSENIVYHDPMYGVLDGEPVFALWRMRCTYLHDLSIKFSNIEALDGEYAICDWEISFFHRSAGHVTMPGKAYMRIINGKIAEHSEGYRISKWLSTTYGWKGKLFGWTGYMKRREQNYYKDMLNRFMNNELLVDDGVKRRRDYDLSDR